MADDIEIEEHDVLQNPRMKGIFPDLSILKREINDYNDYIGYDECSQSLNAEDSGLTDNIPNLSEQNQKASESASINNYQNKIIPKVIGHKRQKLDLNLKKAKVCLQNILPFLNNNPNFCKTCLIVFPKEESFDQHRLLVHSTPIDKQVRKEKSINAKLECNECYATYSSYSNLNRHKRKAHSLHKNNKEHADKRITGVNVMVKINESNFNLLPESSFKECFHCDLVFKTQQLLIEHLYDVLNSRKTHNVAINPANEDMTKEGGKYDRNNGQRDVDVEQNSKEIYNITEIAQNVKIFMCPICSYCFNEWDFYEAHMIKKHEVSKVKQTSRVVFKNNCKFCDSYHSKYKSYNVHLHKCHKAQILQKVTKQISNRMNKIFAPKKSNFSIHRKEQMRNQVGVVNNKISCDNITSIDINTEQLKSIKNEVKVVVHKTILFKCLQCDTHFLTSVSAKDHLHHASLQDTKCIICQRLFKAKDMTVHLEQHKYSNYISVNTCEETDDTKDEPDDTKDEPDDTKDEPDGTKEIKQIDDHRTLHKCPSCVVHFSKEEIFNHYSVCGTEPSKSAYCKVCDILISDGIKTSHDREHEENKLNLSDFKIVEFEMIRKKIFESGKEREKGVPKFNQNSLFHLIHCKVCNCNVLKTHYKSAIHFRSRCSHFMKYVCKYCGLIFSNKSIISHRKLHQKYNNVSLRDFTFYDMKTGKKILPPIPVFPKCGSCDKHFITKFEVKKHVCYRNNHITCPTCNIRLSKTAYNLHMPFHDLVLNNKEVTQVDDDLDVINLPTTSCVTRNNDIIAIFTCNNCNASFNSYEEAVEHCHLHTDLNEINIDTVECNVCDLRFKTSCYEKHQKGHEDFPEKTYNYFKFDLLHFGVRNDKWLKHLFGSISQQIIDDILNNSVYRYETRVKMKVLREGSSDGTAYKCEKCRSYIEPNHIYKHYKTCQQKSCSPKGNIDTCNDNLKMRIVVFNGKEDDDWNYRIENMRKCYVLYECRVCHMVVNGNYENHLCVAGAHKDCSTCGLLFNELDYDTHIEKHKRLSSFMVNLMKVILLGGKNDQNSQRSKDNVMSKFSGIVCDYTFYKCLNCEVCVRDFRTTFQHYCLIDAAKSKCPKCDLVFDEGKLKGHLKLHDSDPYLLKETIFIQSFGTKLNSPSQLKITEINEVSMIGVSNDSVSNIENKDNSDADETIKIYKCQCGLHYLSEATVQTHMKKCSGKIKVKQSKQNCSKCNLTFSPDVLFKHLIEHHGNKNFTFKYDIIPSEIEKITNIESADPSDRRMESIEAQI